ncbi:MAG: Gfo/Idh/MocA family oxidoreductase [Spirochaetia bacterium]|jgi:predicted dehydrogenase
MNAAYRLGVIGFAHMHINTLMDEFAKLPGVEWVACADTTPAVPSLSSKESTRASNLRRAREKIGIPKVHEDYREMLVRHKLDIVIFCPENARHGEVAEAVAQAGAHMVTEKPMASTLSEALRMIRAARRHNVRLAINWPTTWSPAIRTMKSLLEKGVVGEPWEVKWRNGASMGPLAYGTGANLVTDAEKAAEWWHQEKTGGGALLDYCCYGACLSRWFLGQQAVAAIGMKANLTSPYGDAEDNAVVTVRFPKALAILEATWSTWHTAVPIGPVVYCTRGTLVVDHQQNKATGVSEQVVKVYSSRGYAGEPDAIVPGDPLPAGRSTIAEEFIHHLKTGEPLHPTLDPESNLEVMAILDAGIRSAASGKLELVNDSRWNIG